MCPVDSFQHISLKHLHPEQIYPYSYPKDVSAAYFLHIYVQDVCSGYFTTHLCELSISHTPMLKRCVLCIGLNIYFKDVHTGQFLEIYPKKVLNGYFAYTSILKMSTLGIYPHIYTQGVCTGHFPAHLSQRCVLWVFCLDVYLKDVHIKHWPTHLCWRRAYWVFPCTSILKTCTPGLSGTSGFSGCFAAHLS